jgi:hypothetical protein
VVSDLAANESVAQADKAAGAQAADVAKKPQRAPRSRRQPKPSSADAPPATAASELGDNGPQAQVWVRHPIA